MLVWKERVLQEEWGEEEDNEDGGDDAGGSGRRRPYIPEDQRLDFRNIYRWTGTYLVPSRGSGTGMVLLVTTNLRRIQFRLLKSLLSICSNTVGLITVPAVSNQ